MVLVVDNEAPKIADTLLSTRTVDRYRTSSDASHFYLVPNAVATPANIDDISQLFKYATSKKTSITFRSGGTSLSGQSVSDAILIDCRKYFRKIEVLDNGNLVKVQPGATVRSINARLARFGRKLGPDPASEIACTIGGVIANNSSGMACGITHNTYRTLVSATVVLFNGTIINTADQDCELQLQKSVPSLYSDLKSIKEDLYAKPELIERIRSQYQIKNTMGYGLNSFVDYETVTDILLHLLIGSEGTLGFIAEAVFKTIPLLQQTATTLILFPNLISATNALNALIETNPQTIELMDAASLRAGKVDLAGHEVLKQSALLVEYQAMDEKSLEELVAKAQKTIDGIGAINAPLLSSDPQVRASLWHIRKGLYATIAEARRSGTTALLEDIAVPVNRLAETCLGLQQLFLKHGYDDAVIFGHAKDGNIHFMITEDFSDALKAERYRVFTEEMVDLVLSKNGSLKAEHGTGRMMAPFVERQFGPELYDMMKQIKLAFDPHNVINPGVLISEDSLSHMRNIKFNPPIEKVADSCVECGYCEPVCPSKDLTTTPRQRIVLRRAIESARITGDVATYKELRKESIYEVQESCAADGMCESACPVGINTGTLVKELRVTETSKLQTIMWNNFARNWGSRVGQIGKLLSLTSSIPETLVRPINKSLRAIFGSELVPLWTKDLPPGGTIRTPLISPAADFVFFTSCLESMFSSESATSLKSLALKSGLTFTIPESIADLCCGTPWKSKGHLKGYQSIIDRTYSALLITSDNGRLPIVCENSSCSQGLIEAIKEKADNNLHIIDSVDFTAQFLLPKLAINQKLNSVVLHPTCSSTALGSNSNFEILANAISSKVTIPINWGCCAFAGDRGMLHPELTASATIAETASLAGDEFDAYLSTNLTCEIGMSRATGRPYQHILCQLDRLAE